jgi:hypothetical protein
MKYLGATSEFLRRLYRQTYFSVGMSIQPSLVRLTGEGTELDLRHD